MKIATHLPSHVGTIRTGRVANRGERISCRSCQRQIAEAGRQVASYANELARNLAPGYVERVYVDAAARNASLATNMLHYWNLSTYEDIR